MIQTDFVLQYELVIAMLFSPASLAFVVPWLLLNVIEMA